MEKTFTQKDTNMLKGVALLLLLLHHLFYRIEYWDSCITLFPYEDFLIMKMANIAKFCVAMFLFLSGYGLMKSANKKERFDGVKFSLTHIIKVLFMFWFIYLLFVPMGFFFGRTPAGVYGTGATGCLNFLIDFFGVSYLTGTPTWNSTWWYMGEILRMYVLFPILYYGVKKSKLFMLLGGTVLYFFWVIAGVFPFIVGMVFAEEDLLSKCMNFSRKQKILLVLGVIGVLLLSRFMGKRARTVIVIWVVLVSLSFLDAKTGVGKLLAWFGKHSGNIFMFHTFIYSHYFKDFIYGFRYPLLILVVLLAICMAVSMAIEWLKKMLKYHVVEQKLVGLINQKKSKNGRGRTIL